MERSWVLSIPLLGGCVQKLYAELEQVPSVRLCGSMLFQACLICHYVCVTEQSYMGMYKASVNALVSSSCG